MQIKSLKEKLNRHLAPTVSSQIRTAMNVKMFSLKFPFGVQTIYKCTTQQMFWTTE